MPIHAPFKTTCKLFFLQGAGRVPDEHSRKRTRQEAIVVHSSTEEDESEGSYSDTEWVLDPLQMAPTAAAAYHLPAELQDREPEPFDVSSDEDDTGSGRWREGDLGTLVLALNYYRDELKGKFVGASGGVDRKKAAWIKVAGKARFFGISF